MMHIKCMHAWVKINHNLNKVKQLRWNNMQLNVHTVTLMCKFFADINGGNLSIKNTFYIFFYPISSIIEENWKTVWWYIGNYIYVERNVKIFHAYQSNVDRIRVFLTLFSLLSVESKSKLLFLSECFVPV